MACWRFLPPSRCSCWSPRCCTSPADRRAGALLGGTTWIVHRDALVEPVPPGVAGVFVTVGDALVECGRSVEDTGLNWTEPGQTVLVSRAAIPAAQHENAIASIEQEHQLGETPHETNVSLVGKIETPRGSIVQCRKQA